MTEDKDALTFASSGVAGIHYAKCWTCQLTPDNCPGGWHTWADPEDVEHAANTGQNDPSGRKCGCPCADTPERDYGPPEPEYDALDAAPCPICDAQGACGFDNDDRPWIHTNTEDDE